MELRKEDYEYTTERESKKRNSVLNLLGRQATEQLVREVFHSDAILNSQEDEQGEDDLEVNYGDNIF